MSERKRIILFAMGGTISMRYDGQTRAMVPALSGGELLRAAPGAAAIADVDVVDVALVGGPQITPAMVFDLHRRIDEALGREGYDGAVITQGSDTVEEVAYMLDLLLHTEKPVALTAAMRGASDPGADGPRNLDCAIRVSADPAAAGKGVLVVMNDNLFAAVDVIKTHTLNPAAFQAPDRGPLGYVLPEKDRVIFFHQSLTRQKIQPSDFVSPVPIVKAGFGAEPDLFSAAVAAGVPGIIIEALGAGNLPEAWEQPVTEAALAGIPIVIASRCPEGFVIDGYGYPGGGANLTAAGALLAQGLTPVKARVKLMLALGVSRDPDYLREVFEFLY